jgi:hypothetical protein
MFGPHPDGFLSYFLSRFPSLLIEVYCLLRPACKDVPAFRTYFHPEEQSL